MVFQFDEKSAKQFWKGKEISQKKVKELLSQYFGQKGVGADEIVDKVLSDMYRVLSKESHPNSHTLRFRTKHDASSNIGMEFTYGGELEYSVALVNINLSTIYVVYSLILVQYLAKKVLGQWSRVLERKIDSLVKEHATLLI
jgi:hypothetical protein